MLLDMSIIKKNGLNIELVIIYIKIHVPILDLEFNIFPNLQSHAVIHD